MMESPDREVALFNAALELPVAQRELYLQSVCGGDIELRGRVEALLRAGEASGDFMCDGPPERDGLVKPEALKSSLFEKTGDRIGRYKLLQQIGEGGCGTVYMAEQSEPVRRQVALKVIKLGMDTRSVVARFEAERQALALMDHPNIAKVLDAGATDTGRPYFVMELVRGVKITNYCDQNNLPTAQRLTLFIQVCQAIQHAHQKGIIHRDIKPSNILVTSHDGVPVPKVIDFGVAKATSNQRLTDKTLFTAFEQFIGTPAYMSPEQAEFNDLGIDTRSDIYSLGILLYELLTGRTPFDSRELLATGLEAMRRTIREKQPLRPSTQLSSMVQGELASVARQRQTEPPALVHLIRGDLDWIVMKALEKERARRYETANGLAMDVKRHLEGEPVVARPPSAGYRLRLLARKHRLLFAAGSAVLISLVTGIVISTASVVQTKSALKRALVAEHEEDSLRQEADSARERANEDAKRADAASQTARQTLAAADFAEANRLIDGDQSARAIAYLMRILSNDPQNRAALTRLVNLLSSRTWVIPEVSFEHHGVVNYAEFSLDGQRVVSASGDGTAQIWAAESGMALGPTLRHSNAVVLARFSPDGKKIVTASRDGTARVWDGQSGLPLTPLLQHKDWVDWAGFNAEGTRLATASKDGTARIWDAQTGRPLTDALEHQQPVYDAEFSPNGQRLATASKDGTVRVWDALTGTLQTNSMLRGERFYSARFSPDGDRLVTSSFDDDARVWDAITGQPLTPPMTHTGWVNGAVFSPDAKRVVTASWDHTARIWDAETGKALGDPLHHASQVSSARFNADGSKIVTASFDNTARVWDGQTGRPWTESLQHGAEVSSAQFGPDGTRVVTASWDRFARIWKIRPGAHLFKALHHEGSVAFACFSRDGHRVFTASSDKTVRVWDARTGKQLGLPLQHETAIVTAALSPDGKILFTGDEKGVGRFWDAETEQLLGKPLPLENAAGAIAFSPDGKLLAVTGRNGVRIWDNQTGQMLSETLKQEHQMNCVEFSPDGKKFATTSFDWTARVWDTQTGKSLGPPLVHQGLPVSCTFSPDGTLLLTAADDNEARVWDTQTGQLVFEPLRHADRVNFAEFSRDQRRIVTVSRDCSARIWDAKSGRPITEPLPHGYWVSDASFSADSKRVVTASSDDTARVWDVESGQPLTDPLRHGGHVWTAEFSPEGKRVITSCSDSNAYIWDVDLAPEKSPDWLLQLAEALSGNRLTPQGILEPTTLDRTAAIAKLRKTLHTLPDDADGVHWGRWFLDDSTNRESLELLEKL
jgi:WD40 repeat protein/serine/threonine protein kinase